MPLVSTFGSLSARAFGLGAYRASGAFTPLSLFASGEQGVWYDPSDLTTMFEDSSGTTPVHTPGNGTADSPVGKILDKSGRGNHATQSTSTARPTLSARYNILVATDTLSTQSVTTVAATYTLSFSGSGTITLSGTKTGTYSSGSNSLTGVTAGTLTLTVSGTVTNADLRVSNDGVGLPSYQSITNANTYDSTGFPYYLKFDGVDDTLSNSAVDFSGTNKISLFCGVRLLPTGLQLIVDIGGGTSTAAEALYNNSAGDAAQLFVNYSAGTGGNNAKYASNPGISPPLTAIPTALTDISAPSNQLRVNGSVIATNTSSQGSGNYKNGSLYLGSRNASQYYMSGRIFGTVVRGASSTSTEISNTETWLNGKTKAY